MKLVCRCGLRTDSEHALFAPNPFDPSDKIIGCHGCLSVDSFTQACDEPDCWHEASCGTPTAHGYRHTCYRHIPKMAGAE